MKQYTQHKIDEVTELARRLDPSSVEQVFRLIQIPAVAKAWAELPDLPRWEWFDELQEQGRLEGVRLAAVGRPSGSTHENSRSQFHMGRWLLRLLVSDGSRAKAARWLVEQGSQFDKQLRREAEKRLLESGPLLRTISTPWYQSRLDRAAQSPHRVTRSQELLEFLFFYPNFFAKESFFRPASPLGLETATGVGDSEFHLVDWRVSLSTRVEESSLGSLVENSSRAELYALLERSTQLLTEVIEWGCLFDSADASRDPAGYGFTSLAPHSKRIRNNEAWYVVIELAVRAATRLAEVSLGGAGFFVDRWLEEENHLFQRIAIHVVTEQPLLLQRTRTSSLLDKSLWSLQTKRETLRFLRSTFDQLERPERDSILNRILEGPENESDPTRRRRKIQHRLEKVAEHSTVAQEWLDEFSTSNPISVDDRTDELTGWFSSESRTQRSAPPSDMLSQLEQADLAEALENQWASYVRENPLKAIRYVARRLGTDRLHEPVWRQINTSLPIKAGIDQEGVSELLALWLAAERPEIEQALSQICSGLRAAAFAVDSKDLPNYFEVWDRVWEFDRVLLGVDVPAAQAIGHPLGELAEALVVLLLHRKLPEAKQDARLRCERILADQQAGSRAARVVLASWASFFEQAGVGAVAKAIWERLDWGNEEAPQLWEGFLARGQLYTDDLPALRSPLLQAIEEDSLPQRARERVLEWIAELLVGHPKELSRLKVAKSLKAVDPQELQHLLRPMSRRLDQVENKTEYLTRLGHLLGEIWPKGEEHRTPEESSVLCWLCVDSGLLGMSLKAVGEFIGRRPSDPETLIYSLLSDGDGDAKAYPENEPIATLQFLDLMFPDKSESGLHPSAAAWLAQILDRIEPGLDATSPKAYEELRELALDRQA
ncbi:MAG: hypothetical protein AAGA81_01460 [Acidobacteriota bacterium]